MNVIDKLEIVDTGLNDELEFISAKSGTFKIFKPLSEKQLKALDLHNG